jgi:hypothetical protein
VTGCHNNERRDIIVLNVHAPTVDKSDDMKDMNYRRIELL